MTNSDADLIKELWAEHMNAPFPNSFRAKDVSGVDFVMLDADVAGCVESFLGRGNLNLYQTATLGLCYRNLSYVIPIINDEGKEYSWRLERLAELVLTAVALKNEKEVGATSYSLIDRGSYQVPDWGWYDPRNGEWFIENLGITPDYQLEITPSAWRAGRDTQLEIPSSSRWTR